eukprot:1694922-Pleurochrysis_carterae.AAC.1
MDFDSKVQHPNWLHADEGQQKLHTGQTGGLKNTSSHRLHTHSSTSRQWQQYQYAVASISCNSGRDTEGSRLRK